MSYFYLSPAQESIPLHLLENCVQRRVEHLTRILSGIQSEYCEYVIEGSVYDNVGHYMLQLACILSENEAFTQFCIRGETQLFKERLCLSSHYEFYRFARKLFRKLKRITNMEPYLNGLYQLCKKLSVKEVSQHLKSNSHSSECKMYNFESDFKLCLSFVAKRMVEITNGFASVPCGHWILYLTDIFKIHLKARQKLTSKCKVLENDPRVKLIVSKLAKNNCKVTIHEPSYQLKMGLKSSDVDKYSILFPLCMKLLHNVLRKKHRLSHEQRFRYGLFLKEIGMPIEEAILFWKEEYSKPANGSLCCHSWYRDERNYIYSIRHLYGLEGARKKYCMASCSRIQGNNDIISSEGGCPFKNFDINVLSELIDPCVKHNLDNYGHIFNLGSKNFPNTTCRLYFKYLSNSKPKFMVNNSNFVLTPLNYYKTLKENFDW